MESLMRNAVRAAQEKLHSAGLPYVVADKGGKGCLEVYPDGHTEFVPYLHNGPGQNLEGHDRPTDGNLAK
jgi:hypothetical protein